MHPDRIRVSFTLAYPAEKCKHTILNEYSKNHALPSDTTTVRKFAQD